MGDKFIWDKLGFWCLYKDRMLCCSWEIESEVQENGPRSVEKLGQSQGRV